MTAPDTHRWIALDDEHIPPRFWRMEGDVPQGDMEDVTDPTAVQALTDRQPLFRFAPPQSVGKSVPFKPSDLGVQSAPGNVWHLEGLSQSRPLGQLRGSACRIDGFLGLNPQWDGVLCLPTATVTDWALVSAGEVVSFLSFATVPLVSALSPVDPLISTASPEAVTGSLPDVLSRPELLAARVAQARAASVLLNLSPEEALGQIWGAALGAELAGSKPYWLGQPVTLIAPSYLAGPYKAALASQFVAFTETDEARITLEGFIRAYRRTQ